MSFEFEQVPYSDLDKLKKAGVVHSSSTLDDEIRLLPAVLNKIKQTLENFTAEQVGNAQAILHGAQSDADNGVDKIQVKDIEERFLTASQNFINSVLN